MEQQLNQEKPKLQRMPIQVRKVTKQNFVVEFNAIKSLIVGGQYNIVTFDTEYPGHIFKIGRTYPQNSALHYQFIKANVDHMKLIQVSLTLSDVHGNLPDFGTNYVYVWEILLDFNQHVDLGQQESITMLRSQGVNFEVNRLMGISPTQFRERLFWSGLARPAKNTNLTWVTYNGSYDIGYMVKVLTEAALPDTLPEFKRLVREFFGENVYDVKYMTIRLYQHVRGGLHEIARQLGLVPVVVYGHRTVTNALVTLQVFNKIKTSPWILAAAVRQQAGQIHTLSN